MRKKNLTKMIVLNASIALANVLLFSNAFFKLDITSGAFSAALGITVILMSVIVFLYGNYTLLSAKETVRLQTAVKTLEDCVEAIRLNMGKKTFTSSLNTVLDQIKRFKRKQATVTDILLQKFSDTEMSYIGFQNAVTELEKVMYLNIKSLLNRISAFDDHEYTQIIKSKNNPSAGSQYIQSKLEIYNEYIRFVNEAVEDGEQIILKLDKLLFEISKFNSIEDGEIENMDAMREIDDLINNAKWYK